MKLSKVKSEREVTQLCLTLRDPMDCSLPGSSTHGILQARVLEWGATALSNIYVEYLKESTKKKKKIPRINESRKVTLYSVMLQKSVAFLHTI